MLESGVRANHSTATMAAATTPIGSAIKFSTQGADAWRSGLHDASGTKSGEPSSSVTSIFVIPIFNRPTAALGYGIVAEHPANRRTSVNVSSVFMWQRYKKTLSLLALTPALLVYELYISATAM